MNNNNENDIKIYEIPMVLCKGNILKEFDECHIKDVLQRETSATKEEAERVCIEIKREFVFSGIKLITPPLMRELTNSILIKMCVNMEGNKKEHFEIIRLQDTRIGIPRHDLEQLIKKYPIQIRNYMTGHYEKNPKLMDIIFKLVIEEYYAVNDLIKIKSDKINENK